MKLSAFPTRLFRWFVGRQVLLSLVCLMVVAAGVSLWVSNQVNLDMDSRRWVIKSIVFISLANFALFTLVTLFMARRLVIPLGRLINKTHRLRKYPFSTEKMSEQELAYDEPGEWYELERALNKLGRDLRQKTIRLSREKTEFRAIISSMTEAILAVDMDRHPMFYNPQFAFLFDIDNMNTDDLVLSEFIRDPVVLSAYERCLTSGHTERVKLQLEIKNEIHYFNVSIAPLKKKHNQEVYGAVAVFNDVTDLRKMERIRIDFVGNVSHELRTPLTSIMGYLQTIKEDLEAGNTEQSVDFIEIIERNVGRLKLLVDDLLDLSQLESGPALKKQVVDTRELTEGVINMIPSRDHVIHIGFGVEHLKADQGRVEQVLRNLLQNSVRYVPKGRNIWVNWELSGSGVVLRVKDDGPGIPKKHHDRLFERFYRIDESRARDQGGTGIGLSLVKHIMNSHGGTVHLVSDEGQGAEFICEFPTGQ